MDRELSLEIYNNKVILFRQSGHSSELFLPKDKPTGEIDRISRFSLCDFLVEHFRDELDIFFHDDYDYYLLSTNKNINFLLNLSSNENFMEVAKSEVSENLVDIQLEEIESIDFNETTYYFKKINFLLTFNKDIFDTEKMDNVISKKIKKITTKIDFFIKENSNLRHQCISPQKHNFEHSLHGSKVTVYLPEKYFIKLLKDNLFNEFNTRIEKTEQDNKTFMKAKMIISHKE